MWDRKKLRKLQKELKIFIWKPFILCVHLYPLQAFPSDLQQSEKKKSIPSFQEPPDISEEMTWILWSCPFCRLKIAYCKFCVVQLMTQLKVRTVMTAVLDAVIKCPQLSWWELLHKEIWPWKTQAAMFWLVPTGPNQFQLVQTGLSRSWPVQAGSDRFWPAQTGFDRSRLVPIGSNQSKWDGWAEWIKYLLCKHEDLTLEPQVEGLTMQLSGSKTVMMMMVLIVVMCREHRGG